MLPETLTRPIAQSTRKTLTRTEIRIAILTLLLGYLAYSTLIWAPPAYAETITLSSSPDRIDIMS